MCPDKLSDIFYQIWYRFISVYTFVVVYKFILGDFINFTLNWLSPVK